MSRLVDDAHVVATRTGRVLDTGVELAIGQGRPRPTGPASRPEDHGSDVKGWTLWALAASKTRQGARSEIRDDWLCCVRHDLVEPQVGSDGSTKVRTSANRPS